MPVLHWFKGSLGVDKQIHSYSHLFNIKQNEIHSKQHLLRRWTIQIKIPEAQVPTWLFAIKAWPRGCFMGHRDVTGQCSKQGGSPWPPAPALVLFPASRSHWYLQIIHWFSRKLLKLKCRSLLMLKWVKAISWSNLASKRHHETWI